MDLRRTNFNNQAYIVELCWSSLFLVARISNLTMFVVREKTLWCSKLRDNIDIVKLVLEKVDKYMLVSVQREGTFIAYCIELAVRSDPLDIIQLFLTKTEKNELLNPLDCLICAIVHNRHMIFDYVLPKIGFRMTEPFGSMDSLWEWCAQYNLRMSIYLLARCQQLFLEERDKEDNLVLQ